MSCKLLAFASHYSFSVHQSTQASFPTFEARYNTSLAHRRAVLVVLIRVFLMLLLLLLSVMAAAAPARRVGRIAGATAGNHPRCQDLAQREPCSGRTEEVRLHLRQPGGGGKISVCPSSFITVSFRVGVQRIRAEAWCLCLCDKMCLFGSFGRVPAPSFSWCSSSIRISILGEFDCHPSSESGVIYHANMSPHATSPFAMSTCRPIRINKR